MFWGLAQRPMQCSLLLDDISRGLLKHSAEPWVPKRAYHVRSKTPTYNVSWPLTRIAVQTSS